MRVRNPNTGTVINLDTETANAYVSAGWEQVDAAPRRTRARTEDTGDSSTADSSPESESRTRRRRTSK